MDFSIVLMGSHDIGSVWMVIGLQDGTLRAVCDGSYKPCLFKKGTSAAWVIEHGDQSECISRKVAIAGIKADSYRGELVGI